MKLLFLKDYHMPSPYWKAQHALHNLIPAMCLFVFFGMLSPIQVKAQLLKEIFTEDTCIDSLPEKSLRLDIDAYGFFRDNEYETEIQNGYSLPGVRLNPHLAYNPLKNINIEAGASMLFFNGANKYPCFAYHDIATWKGNQYQHGSHVLPWVRLQASFKHLDVVLGDIYGGSNHNLITPFFNPEQNISADPEMGFQLLLHRPHINLDVWMNWQSYIFETDTHQEAFTVGTTAKILWGKQKALSFYTPVQLVIQHRGGEQDDTNRGVQTICNASVGVGVSWMPHHKHALNKSATTHKSTEAVTSKETFNSLDVQANLLGCYQQSGRLWPFDEGRALHLGIESKWLDHLAFGMDYVYTPKQFVSVYGNPFYSTISLKHGGTVINDDGTLMGKYDHQYKGMHNFRAGIDYQYTFAKAYTLGADAEFFMLKSKECLDDKVKLNDISFSFGIYLRVSPSILLKKF